jgi:hypothetical protein
MKEKIDVKLVDGAQRWNCTVCGDNTGKFSIRGSGVDLNYDTRIKTEFCVCEECIEAGDIDSRLKQRATDLVSEAAWVRGLIGRLIVPTFADLQALEAKIQEEAKIEEEEDRIAEAKIEEEKANFEGAKIEEEVA